MIPKNYKPKHTCYYHSTVRQVVKMHKRSCRRAFKQFLRSGNIKDFNRANRMIVDFD